MVNIAAPFLPLGNNSGMTTVQNGLLAAPVSTSAYFPTFLGAGSAGSIPANFMLPNMEQQMAVTTNAGLSLNNQVLPNSDPSNPGLAYSLGPAPSLFYPQQINSAIYGSKPLISLMQAQNLLSSSELVNVSTSNIPLMQGTPDTSNLLNHYRTNQDIQLISQNPLFLNALTAASLNGNSLMNRVPSNMSNYANLGLPLTQTTTSRQLASPQQNIYLNTTKEQLGQSLLVNQTITNGDLVTPGPEKEASNSNWLIPNKIPR
ncbi:hypothetical protein Ciccas_006809 [Cichlidogyrus casuarinus]|uniref:Uncharacterized protein n=1 Tax=Cichlidogyrus casuarinus TaxID=1844966 RepID=A0ABD2Q4P6_9PLAT